MVFVFKCTLMIQFRRFTQPQALRMISKFIARVRPGLKGKADYTQARYRGVASHQPPVRVLGAYRGSEGQGKLPRFACGSQPHRLGGLARRSTAPVRALQCARRRSGEAPPEG